MVSRSLRLVALFLGCVWGAAGQEPGDGAATVDKVTVEPASQVARIGQSLQFTVKAVDSAGKPVHGVPVQWFTAPWDLGSADENGTVRPEAAGILKVGARVGNKIGYAEVQVKAPEATRLEIESLNSPLVVGGHLRLQATPVSESGAPRGEVAVSWKSADERVAVVDSAGVLSGVRAGKTQIRGNAGTAEASTTVEVVVNPVENLVVKAGAAQARTGDVVRFVASARSAAGAEISNLAPTWTIEGRGAEVGQDGNFVAEEPGTYVVNASIGRRSGSASIVVSPRAVQRELEIVAHVIPDTKVPYSEEWIFGQVAYLSTIGDKVFAYDLNDPAHPQLAGSVSVDARLINDVSVTRDGKVGVITREGASTRKNGLVFLDTSDPLHPKQVSEFTDTVTGGVHSAFIDGHYVYATDDATGSLRVIDFSDVVHPRQVARWQLDNPIAGTTQYPLGTISSGRFLHDVFVQNGLAYLSYWRDGLVVLDVGAGIRGGKPEHPEFVSQFRFDYRQPYGDGWNAGAHTAFRYKDYVFVGDEVLPGEYNIASFSRIPVQGIVHVLDVSDITKPREVASYAVPEAGAHNFWVQDDLLYMGYYNGGGRVLDVSGVLRGDLYRQGREVAHLATGSPDGFRPNLPMAWGGQPHDGLIYFNDINSGLWIVKLGAKKLSGSTNGGPN